jgi:DNA polymerase III alpha subunit
VDVDVDVPGDFNPIKLFPNWTRASVVREDKLTPHPCGVHPQAIAKDPITGLAAIPYDYAEDLGFAKIDFLTNTQYNIFKSRDEIDELLKTEPDWNLLQMRSVHPKLFQLAKHGDLLIQIKPKNVIEVSDCMALIRPGKSRFLGLYLKNREQTRKMLFMKDEKTGYAFKKSHSLAYSYVIWLQLRLIEQGKL